MKFDEKLKFFQGTNKDAKEPSTNEQTKKELEAIRSGIVSRFKEVKVANTSSSKLKGAELKAFANVDVKAYIRKIEDDIKNLKSKLNDQKSVFNNIKNTYRNSLSSLKNQRQSLKTIEGLLKEKETQCIELEKNEKTVLAEIQRLESVNKEYDNHIQTIINPILTDQQTLFNAVETNNLELLKVVIANKIDLNCFNSAGFTPLHCASSMGHIGIMRILIANNAKLNITDREEGYTALHLAALGEFIDAVQLLIASGAQTFATSKLGMKPEQLTLSDEIKLIINPDYNQVLLKEGAETDDIDKLSLALTTGINIDFKYENSFSPLHYAVISRSVRASEFLIKKGAQVNITDQDGHSPLYYATSLGHASLVKLLIDNNADIEQASSHGVALVDMTDSVEIRNIISQEKKQIAKKF